MREIALPMLESYGVDLVLSGHSHSYERSYLLDGHYGDSSTFDAAMKLDGGDGRADDSGSYDKLDLIKAPNNGAVYVVAGNAGKISDGTLNHPAMYASIKQLGSVILEVGGNNLDATFIDHTNTVQDYFTITKGPDTLAPTVTAVDAESDTTVAVTYSEDVDAASATESTNYGVDWGVTVFSATLDGSGRVVTLTTEQLAPAIEHILTINDVQDNNGNAIAANTEVPFTFIVSSLHVADIAMSVSQVGRKKIRAEAVVTVLDDLGNPVSGATVNGQWSGLTSQLVSDLSLADGSVSFRSANVNSNSSGDFLFSVSSVSAPSHSYDPADNVESSDCIGSDDSACGGLADPIVMSVDSVPVTLKRKGGNYDVTTSIQIVDEAGNAVPDATVEGSWTLPDSSIETVSLATDSSGSASHKLRRVQAQSGESFSFTVTDVLRGEDTFDDVGPGLTGTAVVP